MLEAFILFTSTFFLVFCLGLQSLNVVAGFRKTAFITSLLIGIMQLIALKLGPDADLLAQIGYLTGGPFGIVASMYFHEYYKVWLIRRKSK